MRWEDPISRNASTLTTTFKIFEDSWSVWFPIASAGPVPTMGAFFSKLLDSQITITDAGIGRLVYSGSLMDLALRRLRASGLEEATERFELELIDRVCRQHAQGDAHLIGSQACIEAAAGAGAET